MTLGVNSGDMAGGCLVRTRTEKPRVSSSPQKVHQECGGSQSPVVTALGDSTIGSPDSK